MGKRRRKTAKKNGNEPTTSDMAPRTSTTSPSASEEEDAPADDPAAAAEGDRPPSSAPPARGEGGDRGRPRPEGGTAAEAEPSESSSSSLEKEDAAQTAERPRPRPPPPAEQDDDDDGDGDAAAAAERAPGDGGAADPPPRPPPPPPSASGEPGEVVDGPVGPAGAAGADGGRPDPGPEPEPEPEPGPPSSSPEGGGKGAAGGAATAEAADGPLPAPSESGGGDGDGETPPVGSPAAAAAAAVDGGDGGGGDDGDGDGDAPPAPRASEEVGGGSAAEARDPGADVEAKGSGPGGAAEDDDGGGRRAARAGDAPAARSSPTPAAGAGDDGAAASSPRASAAADGMIFAAVVDGRPGGPPPARPAGAPSVDGGAAAAAGGGSASAGRPSPEGGALPEAGVGVAGAYSDANGANEESLMAEKESAGNSAAPPPKPKEEKEAEGEGTTVTVAFRDYVDLQTRLVLLPLDDEECLGAKVASYEPLSPADDAVAAVSVADGNDPAAEVPRPRRDGDDPSDWVLSPCSTGDESMDDVSLDDEEKKDGELVAEPTPAAATGDAPGPEKAPRGEEIMSSAASSSVDIVGYVLDGVEGAEEGGEWPDNEFAFILGAIRGAPAPIVLRFVPPAESPSGEGASGERAEDDGSTGIVVEEEGPSSPPLSPPPPAAAAASASASAAAAANVLPLDRVLSPAAAAAATARATAFKGRLSTWGSMLRTSANAAAAEASTRAAALADRAAEKAREAAAERAEARRVEEGLQRAAAAGVGRGGRERRGGGEDGDEGSAGATGGEAEATGEGAGALEEEVTVDLKPEASGGEVDARASDRGCDQAEAPTPPYISDNEDSKSAQEAAAEFSEEGPSVASKAAEAGALSGEAASQCADVAATAPTEGNVESERRADERAAERGARDAPPTEERPAAAAAAAATAPPPHPSTAAKTGRPPMPPRKSPPLPLRKSPPPPPRKSPPPFDGGSAAAAAGPGGFRERLPPPFPRARREIEVPSLLDAVAVAAASDADDDDDVDDDAEAEIPCGMYLQMASGKFAPVEFDEVPATAASSSSHAASAPPPQSPADFFLPPGAAMALVRSTSLSSVASVGSGGSNAVLSAGGGSLGGGSVGRRKADPRRKASRHPVTNSSVLLIRASAESPCPVRGYSYQWYRSFDGGAAYSSSFSSSSSAASCRGERRRRTMCSSDDDSSLASSSVGSGGGGFGGGGSNALGGDVAGWFPLAGATHAAFQPSATDVGHRLRCAVTIESGNGRRRTAVVICELPYPVTADPGLFNAARKSFFEGKSTAGRAMFGRLDGRGNADGRTFRLEVSMGFKGGRTTAPADHAPGVNSRLVVCQVSGRTAEPMHDRREPIIGASAVADASGPRSFELVFPLGLPPSARMVGALCAEGEGGRRFLLRAPNRVTRESFLLALGIANFGGPPSELDARTTLFPGLPPGVALLPEEEEEEEAPSAAVARGSVPGVVVDDDGAEEDGRAAEVAPVEGRDGFVEEEAEKQLRQLTTTPEKSTVQTDEQFQALEDELRVMLEKLFSKEKLVSDLQRRLAQSESDLKRTQDDLSSCRTELKTSQAQHRECQTSLRMAEKRIESNDSVVARLKGDHAARVSSLESRIRRHEETVADHQKTAKSLENEKAVLSAAVEARDGKLAKMSQLQSTVESLQREVAKGASVQKQLDDMTAKYNATKVELGRASAAEKECQQELLRAKKTLQQLSDNIKQEQKLAVDCKTQMESIHVNYQRVKAERNSFKQKADSLSKEMSRICRNGVGIADIEKMMEDHESTKMEVTLLKRQKRRALEELEATRKAHEQSLEAQERAGVDGEAMRALEQRAELERVVSDLTEYVSAKEMQLETLKEVNKTLTEELHMMAQANLGKNDI